MLYYKTEVRKKENKVELYKNMPLGMERDQWEVFSRAMDYVGGILNNMVLKSLVPPPKITLWMRHQEPLGSNTGALKIRITTGLGRFVDEVHVGFIFDENNQTVELRMFGRPLSSADLFTLLTNKISVSVS